MSWSRSVGAVGVVVGVVVALLLLLLLWSVAKDVVCPSLMLMMAAKSLNLTLCQNKIY